MRIQSLLNQICCFAVLMAAFATISSCKKSTSTATTSVQVINASPDAGTINFYLSGNLKTTSPVAYGNSSGYLSAIAGNQTGEIKTAANTTTVVSTPINLTPAAYYSVFLCGSSIDDSFGSVVVQDDLSSPLLGTAKVRCVNTVAKSNVEFTVEGQNPIGIVFFKDIAYKAATEFRDGFVPGTYYITIIPYGPAYTTPGPGPSLTFVTTSLTFVSGKIYTIFFKGQLGTTTGNAKMDLGVITNN